jgi:hypothetical protein
MASAKQCCIPLQLQGPSLEKRLSIMEYDLVLLHERNVEKHDQEGGLTITMPWEMAQVQNMNHACS